MSQATVLGDLIERAFVNYRDRVAFHFDGMQLTYGELDSLTASVAARLSEEGIGSGDSVALLLRNQPEYAVCDLALMRLGAAKVPLNEMLTRDLVGYMLEHSDARLLITSTSLAALVPDSAPCGVVWADDNDVAHRAGFIGDCIAEFSNPALKRTADPDTAAAIYYTGGTTGRPKGVVHTQRSLVANMVAEIVEGEIRDGERMLLATPLPHAAGLFMEAGVVRGAEITVLRGFEADSFLSSARKASSTWTFCVPTMIYRLLDHISGQPKRELPSFETIVYGASPMSPTRLAEASEVWGDVFIQLYGQTECPNWGTRLSKRQHSDALQGQPGRLASCGTTSLLAEVCIVDNELREVPHGADGEVALRSPYVMARYHKDVEATEKQVSESGWLRTGDIGMMDDDGYVFLKDRAKDMIISGGMNVYTTAVEAAIGAVPGVSQAVVVGAPDPEWGEMVVGFVTLDTGTMLSGDEIREACRSSLARYEVPKRIEVLDGIPLTAYGKPDKKVLRQELWQGQERSIS